MTLLQLALDFIDSAAAVELLARVGPAVDLVEAGTPLIKREGISALARLHQAAPDKLLVADLKTVDTGAHEAELAFDAGADITTVLGCASDATVRAVMAVAMHRGRQVVADLIGVSNKRERARELAHLGVDYIGVHTGTDEQAEGADLLSNLALVRVEVATPLVVAGGISLDNIDAVLALDPAIVVVGSHITSAADPVAAAHAFRAAIDRQRAGPAGERKQMNKTTFQQIVRTILDENRTVLGQVDESAVATLLEQLRAAPRVFVLGSGRSGLVARIFATRLMHLGIATYVIGETTTPPIQPDDLLLAFSGSGETAVTYLLAEKGVRTGARLIAITADAESRLARAATLTIALATPHKSGATMDASSFQYGGSLFEQSLFLLCEGVVLQAMRAWNANSAALWARHANLE